MNIRRKRYDVVRALLSGNMNPEEAMKTFDIHCHTVPISGHVAAFVYRSKKARYHVFICDLLSPEARKEVFFHELCHIIEDMPRAGYVLGLDRQRSPMEKRADMFFKEIATALAVE